MTRRTQYQGSASSRRREARAHLQSEASNNSEELHRPTPSRAVMSLKRDVVSRVTKAVDTETEYRKQLKAKAAEYNVAQMPEGSICIPDVAIYQAGHRKSNQVTAR
ncbi:antitermination protein N [Rosenbergiella epipactidis]|uniref:transcriptional antitermination N peptide n=1 Tax=Rosenbergiella epipactidis TaxID=1544694 RepID=UPI001F4E0813|nr:antitermination protein N [Rosenbergiella epipactidis]